MLARGATVTRLLAAAGVVSVPGPAAPPVDVALAEAALDEGLGPYLGHRATVGAFEATSDARALLVTAHRRCVAGDLVRGHVTARALDVLVRRRIPVVLLKAAALDRLIYPEPGQRPRVDTDVLVPPERYREALRALEGAGATVLGEPHRPLTLAIYHERAVDLGDDAVLDVHRRIAAWPLLRGLEPAIFARATATPDGLRVPGPEDLLLVAAVQIAQDGFRAPARHALDAALLFRSARPPTAGRLAESAIAVGAAGATWRWLDALADVGVADLEAPSWQAARRLLRACARAWTPPIVWGPSREVVGDARRGQLVGFDAPARVATLVAYRSASRALDWIWGRAVSRRGTSGTTLPTPR